MILSNLSILSIRNSLKIPNTPIIQSFSNYNYKR